MDKETKKILQDILNCMNSICWKIEEVDEKNKEDWDWGSDLCHQEQKDITELQRRVYALKTIGEPNDV